MTDLNDILDDGLDEAEELSDNSNMKFKCPNCGVISRDDVLFLCNTCDSADLIEKDGVYMCPSCLQPGENFECVLCGSTEVKLEI